MEDESELWIGNDLEGDNWLVIFTWKAPNNSFGRSGFGDRRKFWYMLSFNCSRYEEKEG